MIARALASAERLGAAAAERAAGRIVERVSDVSGVRVERDGGAVTISGRGLARRVFVEPALRWFGVLGFGVLGFGVLGFGGVAR